MKTFSLYVNLFFLFLCFRYTSQSNLQLRKNRADSEVNRNFLQIFSGFEIKKQDNTILRGIFPISELEDQVEAQPKSENAQIQQAQAPTSSTPSESHIQQNDSQKKDVIDSISGNLEESLLEIDAKRLYEIERSNALIQMMF